MATRNGSSRFKPENSIRFLVPAGVEVLVHVLGLEYKFLARTPLCQYSSIDLADQGFGEQTGRTHHIWGNLGRDVK